MPQNPVIWFEIYVQDMARARRFYETVLQRTLSRLPAEGLEMWSFADIPNADGTAGALVQAPVRPKMSIGPFGFVVLASDPDGNMIGLHSMA